MERFYSTIFTTFVNYFFAQEVLYLSSYSFSCFRFAFKGLPDDGAVVCTDSATFEVKIRETSNKILLSSDLLLPNHVDSALSVQGIDTTVRVHGHKTLQIRLNFQFQLLHIFETR